jgi:hypothetical protein
MWWFWALLIGGLFVLLGLAMFGWFLTIGGGDWWR